MTEPTSTADKHIAEDALRRQRGKVWIVVGSLLMISGVLTTYDLTDQPIGGFAASLDDNRCDELVALGSDDPFVEASARDVEDTIPAGYEPPFGFFLRTDGPLDLEEAALGLPPNKPTWVAALKTYEFRGGWARSWGQRNVKTLAVRIYELGDSNWARTFNEFANETMCGYARDAYEVDDVEGTIGMRIVHRDGVLTEQVSFVRGHRRYVVLMASYDHDEVDRRVVIDLVREIDALARA